MTDRASAVPQTEQERRLHWDAKYASTGSSQLSWYQASPERSRSLLGRCGVLRDHSIIDVGGGASGLAAGLVDDGWTDVTVLDVSARALEAARQRCTDPDRVHWINADLLRWTPQRRYDVWHDRAVFHFLVDGPDVVRYREVLRAALPVGGVAVVATFAADGPTHCSGLPVRRYDADELVAVLGAGLVPVETAREAHVTPGGAVQPFTWVALRREG